MSNLESLDDIIKKSRTSKPGLRGRGNPKNSAKNGAKPNGAANGRSKPLHRIEDARFKIIQKKRKHITDARDKLAQIAKQSDARLKLQKLRASNPKKIVSQNQVHKPIRNGHASVVSSKYPPMHAPRPVTVDTQRTVNYRPPVSPDPQFFNDMLMNYAEDFLIDQQRQASLRRTVNYQEVPVNPAMFNFKSNNYFDWDKAVPVHHTAPAPRNQSVRISDHNSRPRDYKVIPRTGMTTKMEPSPSYKSKDSWPYASKTRTILPESSMESKYYSSRNHRETGVKSRLDSSPMKPTRSPATSSHSKSNSSPTSHGFRIVVSNLQPNVTQEDIKELFEDVGELLISRLVKPGIAEVIYKTLKDATKAVETYHNRQLDGHPMKCLLVNPRPKTSSSSTSSNRVLANSRGSGFQSNLVHRSIY
ncbi:hypothetical protein TKK_0002603 [Trichogramma kaykai]|uniref:RRM domain-containing protein n=1 Tax=Trichogramma kaykai TaxID=54128 RepID=A0ABD2WXM6_9HYME